MSYIKENIVTTDLTATEDRIHDFDGNKLTFKNLNEFNLLGESETGEIIFIPASGPGFPFFFRNYNGVDDIIGVEDTSQPTITAILTVDGIDTSPIVFNKVAVGPSFGYSHAKQSGTIVTVKSYLGIITTPITLKVNLDTSAISNSYNNLIIDTINSTVSKMDPLIYRDYKNGDYKILIADKEDDIGISLNVLNGGIPSTSITLNSVQIIVATDSLNGIEIHKTPGTIYVKAENAIISTFSSFPSIITITDLEDSHQITYKALDTGKVYLAVNDGNTIKQVELT